MAGQDDFSLARKEYYEWEKSTSELIGQALLTRTISDAAFLIQIEQALQVVKELKVHPSSSNKLSDEAFGRLSPREKKLVGQVCKACLVWNYARLFRSAVC